MKTAPDYSTDHANIENHMFLFIKYIGSVIIEGKKNKNNVNERMNNLIFQMIDYVNVNLVTWD